MCPQGFADHFKDNLPVYKALFDSNEAHTMPMAEPYQSQLASFQKLCFLRCIRPDKVIQGVQAFVSEHLGHRFIEPPPFDLATCYRESAPATPLIFVLSPGRLVAVNWLPRWTGTHCFAASNLLLMMLLPQISGMPKLPPHAPVLHILTHTQHSMPAHNS